MDHTNCIWYQADEGSYWETSCDNAFECSDDVSVIDGTFQFCCYCGRAIEPEPWTEPSNDEESESAEVAPTADTAEVIAEHALPPSTPQQRSKARLYWASIAGPGATPATRYLCLRSHVAGQIAGEAVKRS